MEIWLPKYLALQVADNQGIIGLEVKYEECIKGIQREKF